jgi:hypothetical protein
MDPMIRVSCLFIYLMVWTVVANSALVERDWLAVNDGALTYDTETGFEWLDISVTANYSYNEILSQLGPGGDCEGFDFATSEQVIGLFSAVNLQEIPSGISTEGSKIQELLQYWSVTWDLGTGERTEFLTANTQGLNPGQHWAGRVFWLELGMAGAAVEMYIHDDNFKASGVGSALVRPAVSVAVDGDVNDDGMVNLGDLIIIFRVVLGSMIPSGNEPARADLYPQGSPDGIISLSDLILLHKQVLP